MVLKRNTKIYKTLDLLTFKFSSKISINSKEENEDMLHFYKMLKKMKKKRPNMDIIRLMTLVYQEKFDPNQAIYD